MKTKLRKLSSFEEVNEFVSQVLREGIPYLADWDICFAELLEVMKYQLHIVDTIERQNPGKTLDVFSLKYHAAELKRIAVSNNLICGYADFTLVDTITREIRFSIGINAIPIENNGTIYFSPSTRLFMPEPIDNLSFGEIKISNPMVIW